MVAEMCYSAYGRSVRKANLLLLLKETRILSAGNSQNFLTGAGIVRAIPGPVFSIAHLLVV